MKYVETGTDHYHSVGYEYDTDNNLTSLVETINGTDYTTSYVYDDDSRLTSMTTNGTTVEYTYDDYGRVTTQVTKRGETTILTETFTYVNPSETTTSSQIATYSVVSANYSNAYAYGYDDNGNIVQITDNNGTTEYSYDSANQLIREDNEDLGFSHVWAYDNAGNIQTRAEYSYFPSSLTDEAPTDTVTYLYGDSAWGDLLTTYDGQAITYDTIGNPLSDGTRTYTWEHGRELSSLTQNNVTWNYTYDSNGMRTSRTNGTRTFNYIYSGSKLMQMSVDGYTFNFTYDASGTPLTITLNGYTYYYVTNIQGDVVGILNEDGVEVVRYGYDAWGNVEILYDNDQISSHNPLLYRGYVYDFETKLYYLQSRYYDPGRGRFINADDYTITGQGLLGNNMFTYCGNNPVIRVDYCGEAWGTIAIIAAIVIGCIVAIAIDHHVAKRTDDGTAAVYEDSNGDGHKVTALYAKGSGFTRDSNGFTILDSELGVLDFEYEETQGAQNLKMDYLNLLTAEAVAEVDWSGIFSAEAGAVASIYTAKFEYSFNLLSMHITILGDFHAGAAAVGAEFDLEEYRFKITPPQTGLAYSLGVDFDVAP